MINISLHPSHNTLLTYNKAREKIFDFLRDYQQIAVKAVLDAFTEGKQAPLLQPYKRINQNQVKVKTQRGHFMSRDFNFNRKKQNSNYEKIVAKKPRPKGLTKNPWRLLPFV